MTDSLSYKDAGVDIDAGNALVDNIKDAVKRTTRKEVMGGIGGFGALCEIPEGYKQPVLVSGTDGVGTKLRLAIDLKRHDSIGIDLVAMCVNDLIVAGAEPLYFLDYYATGKLDINVATDVVKGIAEGCLQSNCALVGGETAEMPGMYEKNDYDLAGFCTGVVEKADIIDGSQVAAGQTLIALKSSGPHSNGYSLIRKVLEVSSADLDATLDDGTVLADALMAPTKIYVKSLLQLFKEVPVYALSHITGGGFLENIPRVLPSDCKAEINTQSWQVPAVFNWLQQAGNIEQTEMYRTFNCGVGMVLAVDASQVDKALDCLKQQGEDAFVIGKISVRNNQEDQVLMINE